MTVKNNTQLFETISLLILIEIQSRQCGVLSVEPMIDQVKEPLLKRGLQMFINGRDAENIKETLQTEVDSRDVYGNLVLEGVTMIASSEPAEVMEERFKTYLSSEDQAKLDIKAKGVLKDWEEKRERGEIVF